MKQIEIDSLSKSYGGHPVLQNFSAVIPYGRTTCIMAASGVGKTTLLRILMGLEHADSGTVRGLRELKVSAVFQEDRLCDNLNAAANIALVRRQPPEEIEAAMRAVDLIDCAHLPVRDLSGGMRRRVALLRALLADFEIAFLDEPFKGLDWATKQLVIAETKRRCAGKTVLLVTHDPDEAELMEVSQYIRLNPLNQRASAVGNDELACDITAGR